MKKGYVDNIETVTEENDDFRRVLYTGHNLQLVVMAIQPGEEIGMEIHDDRDQFFRIEAGTGEIWIDGVCNKVSADMGIIVPQICYIFFRVRCNSLFCFIWAFLILF